jgi:3-deoxy-D-manno-octulosonic-acid transferase
VIVDEFVKQDAVNIVQDALQAQRQLLALLENTEQRHHMLQHATTILHSNQGSVLRHIQLIDQFLASV